MSTSAQSPPRLSQTWVHALAALLYIGLATVGFNEINIRRPVPGSEEAITRAVETLNCDGHSVVPDYTGFEPVDQVLRFFVVAFLPGVAGFDKSFWALQVYFLFSWFPVISIWAVEAGRKGNSWSLISFPAMLAVFYQTIGGAVVCPLVYLGYLYTSRRTDYFSTAAQSVSTAYARALLPALLLGYLLPTILMYLPLWDQRTQQTLIALWQPCPTFPSLLATFGTPLFSRSNGDGNRYLKTLYVVGFGVATFIHISIVTYCMMSYESNVSFASVFDLRILDAKSPPGTAGIKYIFQLDFWITFTACMTWAFLAIYDLRRLNKTRVPLVRAVALLASGSILFGPAATLAATWYWREQLLLKTKRS